MSSKGNWITSGVLAFFTWIGQACSPLGKPVNIELSDSYYYDKTGNEIIYSPMGNWFALGESKMEGVDVQTFEVLSIRISKDKDKAYREDIPIEFDIDLATFSASDEGYMFNYPVDKDHVYTFNNENKLFIIEGADPTTFFIDDANWGKDHEHHFYNNVLVDADYYSFEALNDHFCKDVSSLYTFSYDAGVRRYLSNILETTKMDDIHVYDANALYRYSWYVRRELVDSVIVIPYADLSNIQIYDDTYIKVGSKIYGEGIELNANAADFVVLDYFYAKDQKRAFWWGLEIEGSDGHSFEVLSGSYARDSDHVYYEGEMVEKADPATFGSVKDWYYHADDKHKFYEGKILRDEDV